jgi:serine/threonine protein kinase
MSDSDQPGKGQWEKIKQLFADALELEPGLRAGFLRQACGPDDQLRAEVESLLAAHAQSDDLSQNPWRDELLMEPPSLTSVGPYQLIRKIGEGGMGEVWLAEQTAPVRRQVAIKLIRAGIYDGPLLQRFQSERQSLAMMDHPAIARVLEAGSTPGGQPYLVMEYVPGLSITDFCDQKKLTIRGRLELFIRVCEGVQHAHQKAIIHRDLKPSNILVVEVDGKPMPRIIDFGLAKAAVAVDFEQSLTQAGIFVGTPGYMSPEQADAGVHDVDTRADVYSLGVVLYILLTGFLPLEARNQPLHEMLRKLRDEDPPRPSTRVGMEKQSSSSSAALRGTQPAELVSLLHGDLDWIAMKALEKDRNRRYGTPSELAADVGRYLNYEPVMARPASAGYRLSKYVRRHRIGVSVAAAFLILLAGFVAIQAAQLRRITRERDRADRVTGFMSGMFKVSDPGEARGNSVTAREILDRASSDIDSGLSRDPELQAQMMNVMGNVYKSLGLYERARPLLGRSVETRRRLLGADDPQTLSAMDDLAWTLDRQSRFAEAEKLQRETLDRRRGVLGPEHPDTLQSMMHLADTLGYQGRYLEAEKLQRTALNLKQRVLGPEHPDTLMSMSNLTSILGAEARYREAEELQRRTLEIRRRVLGPEHPETLRSMVFMGWVVATQGRYPEGEQIQRDTFEIQRRVLGPEHPDTLRSMDNLAWTFRMEGRNAEAEKLLTEALALQRPVLGLEHVDTLGSMRDLAAVLDAQGRYAEAGKLQRETLDVELRAFGHDRPETAKAMENLAWTLQKQGYADEAEKLERETFEIRRRVLGPDHPHTALAAYILACMEALAGRRDEALSLLREAMEHGLATDFQNGMERDPDLKSLRGDPRFQAFIAQTKKRAAGK